MTTIITKNSSTAGAVPTSGDLVQGELAVNVTDKRIYTENASGTVVELGTNPSTLTVTSGATVQGLTVGKGAGSVATNTAVGASALALNSTGSINTAVGANSMSNGIVTGTYNSGFGFGSLYSVTSGAGNTATGASALQYTTTGGNNTASGVQALYNNTTASRNTAVGYQAGYAFTTGYANVCLGYQAGLAATGTGNTILGDSAGKVQTSGDFNLYLGEGSGSVMTTGSKNTILGGFTGNQGGLDIRTASNYIVLSDGDGNPRGIFDSSGNLLVGTTSTFSGIPSAKLQVLGVAGDWIGAFQNATSTPFGLSVKYSVNTPNNTGSQFLYCADSSALRFELRSNGGIANFSANNVNLSDERTKTDIQDAGNYLAKICAIPVRTFKYKDQTDDLLNLGVIAQEVEAVAPELVDTSGFGETPEDGVPLKAIYQTDLQYALMKCIQEQQAIIAQQSLAITQLQADVAALKGKA